MTEMPLEINTSEPHPAPIYDYFICGQQTTPPHPATPARASPSPPPAPPALPPARVWLPPAPPPGPAYTPAAVRDPAAILSHPDTRAVLDFGQPIALMLVAILHFVPDEFKPAEIIATLVDALPSGSYLVASHLTTEHDAAATSAGQQTMREAGMAMQKRDSDVFAH